MKHTLLMLLLGLLGLAACHRHAHNNASAYACPMDCEKGKTYPQPGICPVCKMDLVPVAPAPAAAAQDTASPLKTLQADVMRIHDEAMVEMANMNRLKRDIKEFMTRAKMTQEGLKKYNSVLESIDKAEAAMMEWMAAYKEPAAQPEAEAMQYLQAQRDKIAKVQADIRAAIAAGKELGEK